MSENTYAGKFINGKKIVDVSSDAKFVNFYFEDGSYDVAPIVDGQVVVTFDEVTVSQETDYVDMEGSKIDVPEHPRAGEDEDEESFDDVTVDGSELGFYKTLQPIPYTNEQGEEIGVTEVGSIQEVPVALGDYWVAQGLAEKVDQPTQVGLGAKVAGVFSGLLGNK